jgi:phosphoglycolate phosphatase
MNKSLPRAVIFDWDNTLVDSWGAISEAINFVRARYGLETWDREGILANCTRSARAAFPEWFGEKWEEAWHVYYDHFVKVRSQMGINKAHGAEELLEWLQDKEIPALVVSNKSGEHLRVEAEQLNWKRFFVAVVGAHDAPYDKPAREHADHALLLAGLENGSDIWFIGDSETDIACARNSECTPMLIGDQAYAEKLGVEMFFQDCNAVMQYLKRL